MTEKAPISHHGSRLFRSPLRLDAVGSVESLFIRDEMHYRNPLEPAGATFERAGPREQLFFEPAQTKVAIVTCGGLCPGLNNVIRSVYLQLHYHYGVPAVLGIRNGYSGFSPEAPAAPLWLNAEIVNSIHQFGGTLLGTSRGPVSADIIVDFLQQRGINILFTVGGDGTQSGAHDIVEKSSAASSRSRSSEFPKPSTTMCSTSTALSATSLQSRRPRKSSIPHTWRLAAFITASAL